MWTRDGPYETQSKCREEGKPGSAEEELAHTAKDPRPLPLWENGAGREKRLFPVLLG